LYFFQLLLESRLVLFLPGTNLLEQVYNIRISMLIHSYYENTMSSQERNSPVAGPHYREKEMDEVAKINRVNRRELARSLNQARYHQRIKVETIFSVPKKKIQRNSESQKIPRTDQRNQN